MFYSVQIYECENFCLFLNVDKNEFVLTDFVYLAKGPYIENSDCVILLQHENKSKNTLHKEINSLVSVSGSVWNLVVDRKRGIKIMSKFNTMVLR